MMLLLYKMFNLRNICTSYTRLCLKRKNKQTNKQNVKFIPNADITVYNSHPLTTLKSPDKRKKKTLGVLELKFIDGKALPISTKDNRHFKAFVRELDPRFLFYSAA